MIFFLFGSVVKIPGCYNQYTTNKTQQIRYFAEKYKSQYCRKYYISISINCKFSCFCISICICHKKLSCSCKNPYCQQGSYFYSLGDNKLPLQHKRNHDQSRIKAKIEYYCPGHISFAQMSYNGISYTGEKSSRKPNQ